MEGINGRRFYAQVERDDEGRHDLSHSMGQLLHGEMLPHDMDHL